MNFQINEVCSSPLLKFEENKSMTSNAAYSSGNNLFHKTILVVEDDEDTRLMLKYLLEIWNYKVIEAVNGETALILAETHQPDVILMDYRLPQIDGVITTERLREMSGLEKSVIIFVSSHSEEAIKSAAAIAGADAYLVKPIDFGKLEIALEKHLRARNNWMSSSIKSV